MSSLKSEEIFHAARLIPAGPERVAYLESACGDDASLRGTLVVLLNADKEAGGIFAEEQVSEAEQLLVEDAQRDVAERLQSFKERGDEDESMSVLETMEQRAGVPLGILLDSVENESPLVKITDQAKGLRDPSGRYQVLGEIGRGGMGVVYKGRDRDLGRDVAMKVLQDRFVERPEVLARFVEEAQIGGQLQHPGIVPVYELGIQAGERPYFAMKLVQGETLAEQLRRRANPAQDRFRLLGVFEQVCQAMAYAHSRNVVHRDLKPGNVMIGSFGEVQVVDWGFAKVMQRGADGTVAAPDSERLNLSAEPIETVRSSSDSGSQSLPGSMMGTPAYMSPEQATGDHARLDQRGDVFGLGAVLCKILTGDAPYRRAEGKLVEQAAKALLGPARERLAKCGAEAVLVQLCLDCLAPKAEDRPNSALEISTRLADYFRSVEESVTAARVEAAAEKVRSAALVRTQRLTACLSLVIAMGLSASLWFWKSAEDSAGVAFASERVAVAESERAVEIKNLITNMLLSVTPERAQREDNTLLKGILADAAVRLNDGSIGDESMAAELHGIVGQVYLSLGLHDDADQHLGIALEISERVFGAEDPRAFKLLAMVANLRQAQARYDEARDLNGRALTGVVAALGGDHPTALDIGENLGVLLYQQGQLKGAEASLLASIAKRVALMGAEHPRALKLKANLGIVYVAMGRYEEAEPLYAEALEAQRRLLGDEDLATVETMGNYAALLLTIGRYEEGEPLLRKSLDGRMVIQGPEHPRTLVGLGNLGLLYLQLGRLDEAVELLTEVVETRKRVLGENHPGTLRLMSGLANALEDQGHPVEAEALFREALSGKRVALGEEHPSTLGTWSNLAQLQFQQGELEAALLDYELCVEAMRRALGDTHPRTMNSIRGLANTHDSLGHRAEALGLRRELLEAELLGTEDPSADIGLLNDSAWTLLTHDEEELRDPKRALGFAMRVCAMDAATWEDLDTLALAQFECGELANAVATQRRVLAEMPEGDDYGASERLAEYEAALAAR